MTKEDLKQIGDLLDDKLDDFAIIMAGQFEKVDERFDKMDDRFDKMDDRFDEMDKQFAELKREVSNLRYKIEMLSERIDKLEQKILNLAKMESEDVCAVNKEIETIKTQMLKMQSQLVVLEKHRNKVLQKA